MISIKDIAKAIGASPSSVSIVLNGKAKQKRISDSLAAKIIAKASEMGYHPNRVAVGLRTGKSKSIGLIVENISNNFFSSLAKTIEDEARKYGYNVVYCSTENDAVKGGEMIQMLYNQQVDGYLITPASGMEADIKNLLAKKKPVVLMDRYFTEFTVPYVIVDNYAGMEEGMEYLIKSGFTNIGFVTVNINLLQIEERKRAYEDALKEHDLLVEEDNILQVNYFDEKKDTLKLICKFLTDRKELEVVVFATNYLGIYGLQCIKELHLKVPNDIRVICFDDHDVFELFSPSITVIKQPIGEIAMNAVSLLIRKLEHRDAGENSQIILKTEIILRESV